MGKSNKKVKSERVNALRKQYDVFLEEDRKRKERNDYILGRLDKMRFAAVESKPRYKLTSVVNMRDLSTLGLAESMFHQEYLKSQPQLNRGLLPINLGLNNNLNENIILKEIEKKFILIPKLTSISFNQQEVADSDIDWKSKYNILDQLKLYEKEEPVDLKANTKLESNGEEMKSLDKIEKHPEKRFENKEINLINNTDNNNEENYLLRQNQEHPNSNSQIKNNNTATNYEEYSKMTPNTPVVNDIYAESVSNSDILERDATNIPQNNEPGPKCITEDLMRNNVINKDTAADTYFGYEGPNKNDTEIFGNECNTNKNNYDVNTWPSNEQNNETIIDDKDDGEKEVHVEDSNTNNTNITNPNENYEPIQYSTDLPSNNVCEEKDIYDDVNEQSKNWTPQDTQKQSEHNINFEVQSQNNDIVTNEHPQGGNVYNNQYDPSEQNQENYDIVPPELPSSEQTDAYYPEPYQSQYYQQEDENQIQNSELINNTAFYQNNGIETQETALPVNNLYHENSEQVEISNQQKSEQSGYPHSNETIKLNVTGNDVSNNIHETDTQATEDYNETFVNDMPSQQYAYNTVNYDQNGSQQYNPTYDQSDPQQYNQNYNQNDTSQHIENYDQNDPQQYNQQNDPSQHIEDHDQNDLQQYNQNYPSQHIENYDQNDPSQHIQNYNKNDPQQYNQSYDQNNPQEYNTNFEQNDPQYNQNGDDQQQYNNEYDQTYEHQYEGQTNNELIEPKNVQEN